MADSITNVFVHVEATRAGAGLGLLPCFMADRHDDLVRVLADEVDVALEYWLVMRPETARRPGVAAVVRTLHETVAGMGAALLGRRGPGAEVDPGVVPGATPGSSPR